MEASFQNKTDYCFRRGVLQTEEMVSFGMLLKRLGQFQAVLSQPHVLELSGLNEPISAPAEKSSPAVGGAFEHAPVMSYKQFQDNLFSFCSEHKLADVLYFITWRHKLENKSFHPKLEKCETNWLKLIRSCQILASSHCYDLEEIFRCSMLSACYLEKSVIESMATVFMATLMYSRENPAKVRKARETAFIIRLDFIFIHFPIFSLPLRPLIDEVVKCFPLRG